MSKQASEYKSKTHSFYTLLEEQKIEIPIMQRDYVQGREDKEELLERFLRALKNSLEKDAPPITLDFIYGSIVKGAFQPIDGQQRLTTLFLLHWYAALKENVSDGVKERLAKLSRFSYENEKSFKGIFCRSLVTNPFEIDPYKEGKPKDLSKKIKSFKWFKQNWEWDPTIKAMLGSIDHINCLFSDIQTDSPSLWKRLTSSDNSKPRISFNYVELEQIDLTDDLYIRMNARGRLLTSFEEFKAEFEKHLNTKEWYNSIPFEEKFATKIDTIWSDFFWKYYKKNDSIDSPLLRFIASAIAINTALKNPSSKEIINVHNYPDYLKPARYNIDPSLFTEDSYNYLRKCFDIYCNVAKHRNKISLSPNFPLWNHDPKKSDLYEKDYTKSIISYAATYTKKVLFFAQTEYLRRIPISRFNQEKFWEWMRVVRNIVSRGCGDPEGKNIGDTDRHGKRLNIIRSPEAFAAAIELVNELAKKGCKDIYAFLSSSPKLKSKIMLENKIIQAQIEEECEKARLISKKASLKEFIWKCEDNELLRGRINFIFYCIGHKPGAEINEKKLSKVQAVFDRHFNKKTEQEITGDLRRAFLTIEVKEEYWFYYWDSWSSVKSAPKWKLFSKYGELQPYLYCDRKEYFKKLVFKLGDKLKLKNEDPDDDLRSVVEDFKQKLKGEEFNQKMANEKMPKWKQKLITKSELLDEYKYIVTPTKEQKKNYCYLLKIQNAWSKNYKEIRNY